MQHIKFRSIERFEHIVEYINKRYFPKPTLRFQGTVKLHGTNIGICYNNRDGLWVQSRSQILSENNDNAGSWKFVMERKEGFEKLIKREAEKLKISLNDKTISLYGELCGKGIQKNVGISQIEKSIFLFSKKISDIDDPENCKYYQDSPFFISTSSDEIEIHNAYWMDRFTSWSTTIDFSNPVPDLEHIESETNTVENECPVAREFGIENSLGEGIVWSCFHNDEWIVFKTKGEKHSMKMKKLFVKSKEQKAAESIAEQVTTIPRLDQIYDETFDVLNGGNGDIKRIGEFIKAVVKDIEKEEYLELQNAGLNIKDVSKPISQIAKVYFFNRIKCASSSVG